MLPAHPPRRGFLRLLASLALPGVAAAALTGWAPPPAAAAAPRDAAPAVAAAHGGDDTAALLARLKADPTDASALPNRRYRVTASADTQGSRPATAATFKDKLYGQQWGLNNTTLATLDVDIDFPEVHRRAAGAGVIVGVLDTGIDIGHTDLRDSVYTNLAEKNGTPGVDDDHNGYIDDVHGWDFANDDNSVFDDAEIDQHGTHVAGTIAAAANKTGIVGVAPGVRILPLKFIGGDDGGWTDDAVEAIAYAKKMGARVINASWGGYGGDAALQAAVASSGAVVVAAAGNDGVDTDSDPFYPASLPLGNVVSVAAIDRAGKLPVWSNRGRKSVDVAAPGVDIVSTIPGGYGIDDGTSMASPYVAGVAALIAAQREFRTAWDPAAVADRLRTRVTKLPSLTKATASGGLVNAPMALGLTPASGFGIAYAAGRAKLAWRTPRTASSVLVRLVPASAAPGPFAGTPVYSGPRTSAGLPALPGGKDYRLELYARDSVGYRAPLFVALSGSSLVALAPRPGRVKARLVDSAGAWLPGRTVSLADASGRIVCRTTTDGAGVATCRVKGGAAQWRFGGAGTNLPATAAAS